MAEVASDLISNIEGYQQLLTTLSLGVLAGTFALATQVIFHNASNNTVVRFNATWLIMIGVVLLALSIFGGVLTKSALVSSVPALHAIQWGEKSAMSYLGAAGLSHIAWFAMGQIVTFLFGVASLLLVLLVNLRMLR